MLDDVASPQDERAERYPTVVLVFLVVPGTLKLLMRGQKELTRVLVAILELLEDDVLHRAAMLLPPN